MKLLTLNCHSWQEKEQLRKIEYIAETIKEKHNNDPDKKSEGYDYLLKNLIDTYIIY